MKKKNVGLKEKMKKEPVDAVLGIIFSVVVLAYFVLLIAGQYILGDNNHLYLSLNFFNDYVSYNIYIRVISYALFIFSISKIFRLLINEFAKLVHHKKSILNLLSSFIKYSAFLLWLFIALNAFGVNTTTLLASAGILSLIVGLGAQSLIEDVIAGLFIAFENEFEVDDIVVIDGFRGKVIEIGIRSTKVMDTGGNVKVINNSDIRNLVNMTNELSYAVCTVDIEYGESLARVENVIENNLASIKEKIPAISNGPFYKGVQELGASGVQLKFVAQCKEENRYQVERDLNRQIKLMFDDNDINIPFTQIVLHDADKAVKPAGNAKKADNFVEKQRKAGANAGDNPNNLK